MTVLIILLPLICCDGGASGMNLLSQPRRWSTLLAEDLVGLILLVILVMNFLQML